VKQLPAESALSRALNGGRVPWGNAEHLIADLWALMLMVLKVLRGERPRIEDHPVRAKQEAESAYLCQTRESS
jgi:hypothetical protein